MAVNRLQVSDNGVIKSPLSVEIPPTDLFSYIVSSGTPLSRQSPSYFDAISPSANYTIEDAVLMAKRFGRGLQSLGLKTQDKVLLYSKNDLFFPVVVWGVTAAGGVFTGASPTASAHELEYQLRDSEATILISSVEGLSVAKKAADKVGLSFDRVLVLGSQKHQNSNQSPTRSWTDIWTSPEEADSWVWEQITTKEEAMATTAVINYSSGTTGLPKGVELTHYNLLANAEQIIKKRLLVGCAENIDSQWGIAMTDVFPRTEYKEEHKLPNAIRKAGYDIKDVKGVIFGHLHIDHAGGLEHFIGTDVPIYVHELEFKHACWAVATGADRGVYLADYLSLDSLNWKTFHEPHLELFRGITLHHAPGHTPGLCMMQVNLEKDGTFICTTDQFHVKENHMDKVPQGWLAREHNDWVRSSVMVDCLQRLFSARLLYGHDKQVAEALISEKPYFE